MAIKRPPQHRVDAKPVFVSEGDDAWDQAKIKAEIEALEAKKKGLGQTHPVARYLAGETRFDIIDALPYLDTSKAYQFILRPLTPEERAEVEDMRDRKGEHSAFLRAARYCLTKIEGPPDAPESLDEVARLWPWMPEEIGFAARMASIPPTDAEKKP